MADFTLAPGSPGQPLAPSPMRAAPTRATRSTYERLVQAWAALPTGRRRLTYLGVVAVVVVGVAATSVVALSPAAAIVLVGLVAGAAAVVDQHEHRIPNLLSGAALCTVAIAAIGEGGWTIVDVSVSLAMASFPLWAVRYGKGLALGDVKLAAVLGAAAGLVHPFAGLLVAWCATLAAGLFALATRRSRLALGPWLWAGYVAAVSVAVVFVRVLEMGGRTWPARP
jgi:leader peptidase (prepilin peptidase) / N-methyltransferase